MLSYASIICRFFSLLVNRTNPASMTHMHTEKRWRNITEMTDIKKWIRNRSWYISDANKELEEKKKKNVKYKWNRFGSGTEQAAEEKDYKPQYILFWLYGRNGLECLTIYISAKRFWMKCRLQQMNHIKLLFFETFFGFRIQIASNAWKRVFGAQIFPLWMCINRSSKFLY